jgi:drug/metabolite transporter (DMT)-like permease
LLDSVKLLKGDVLYLIPLCLIYAIAWIFGLMGNKHLGASVVSTIENIEGALMVIIIYYYFLLTGYIHPSYNMGVIDVIATVVIVIGIVLIGREEQALMKQEINLSEDKKKHRFGALALLFPIFYNLADAVSMVATGIMVSGETEFSIPDMDYIFFESLAFSLFAIFVWLYLLIAKKYVYNPFKKTELYCFGAATCESLGTIAFTFAVAISPILTAPITSSYCLVTIVLARILLKERLTKKQYLSLAFLVAGITLLGISEILSA